MKILHIRRDGPTELSERIIRVQSEDHEINVIDLPGRTISYEDIVDAVFSCDRVISW
ncbi:MAG: hypothetical protein AB1553_14705 [Nitrospirota bacterium]